MLVESKQKLGFRLQDKSFFVIPPKEKIEIPEEVANDSYFKSAVKAGVVSVFTPAEKPVEKKAKKKEE